MSLTPVSRAIRPRRPWPSYFSSRYWVCSLCRRQYSSQSATTSSTVGESSPKLRKTSGLTVGGGSPGLKETSSSTVGENFPELKATSKPPQTAPSQKPFYVTTPIFYVNATPHVGHMYSMVLADALRRWQALKGRPAVLSTGTDEHGMKVQRAAERAGTTPRQLCDANSQSFRDLAAACNLSPSPDGRFVRTTDRAHVDAVTHVWTELARRDYIYASRHAGWYCVQDEAFYPESAVERRWDPLTGRAVVASVETGGEVEWVEETNYHFRLSAFRDQLLDFYRQRPDWIVPKARMNEVVAWVDKPGGLEDLSVSRPSERLSWGIPVPGDPSQTIYVWIDALVNYATVAGYPNLGGGMDASASLWPPDVHVIGKDITRFHCVYWPAMLFALGLEPPSRVLSHAHWTLGRRKMSKSRGNVVNPFFAIDRFGTDVVRYYLLHDGGIADDADYENSFVVERYKHNLQSGLGNLVSRVTRPRKLWKVEEAVAAVGDGDVPPGAIPDRDGLVVNLASFVEAVDRDMERLQPSAALKSIQKIVDEANKYINTQSPWNIARGVMDAKRKAKLHGAVYALADMLRITGILLQPFMPSKAAELLDILGVSSDRRRFQDAVFGADLLYGKGTVEPGKNDWDGLFPRLPVED